MVLSYRAKAGASACLLLALSALVDAQVFGDIDVSSVGRKNRTSSSTTTSVTPTTMPSTDSPSPSLGNAAATISLTTTPFPTFFHPIDGNSAATHVPVGSTFGSSSSTFSAASTSFSSLPNGTSFVDIPGITDLPSAAILLSVIPAGEEYSGDADADAVSSDSARRIRKRDIHHHGHTGEHHGHIEYHHRSGKSAGHRHHGHESGGRHHKSTASWGWGFIGGRQSHDVEGPVGSCTDATSFNLLSGVLSSSSGGGGDDDGHYQTIAFHEAADADVAYVAFHNRDYQTSSSSSSSSYSSESEEEFEDRSARRIEGSRKQKKSYRAGAGTGASSVSTTFAIADGVLRWYNDAFYSGSAGWCQVAAAAAGAKGRRDEELGSGLGQVYATFKGRETWPEGCEPVDLAVYYASQCQDGAIVPGDPPPVGGDTYPYAPPPPPPPHPAAADPEPGYPMPTPTAQDIYPEHEPPAGGHCAETVLSWVPGSPTFLRDEL
ncbi:hypothetical protein AAE478_008416 [Parahypoxylon ruwenzoriense]